MSVSHAQPGEAIGVLPAAGSANESKSVTLIKTATLEVIRLVVPAGKQLAQHRVPGEIMLQCLAGSATLDTDEGKCELTAGELTHLAGGQEHSLNAKEDSILLLTILLAPKGA
jgi:quercetin dioxygenase-like cupin family protein